MNFSNSIRVSSVGSSKFGLFKEKTFEELFLEAFDSMTPVFDKEKIDAVYVGNFSSDHFIGQSHLSPIISNIIGCSPKPVTRVEGACASSALAFIQGLYSIMSGMHKNVLVCGIELMSRCNTKQVTDGLSMALFPDEKEVGLTFPGVFGLLANRYFYEHGCVREDLMNVTIKGHMNAKLNEKAQIRKTIEEIMRSKSPYNNEIDFLSDEKYNPTIADPLHLYDCCPVSDGAVCVLLSYDDCQEGIFVKGFGQGSGKGLSLSSQISSFEATKQASFVAYEMANVISGDIKVAEVHDCFSIAEIIHTEDLGFFEEGEGYKALHKGLTRLGGKIPVNPSGGLKCKGHPVGATGLGQIYEVIKYLYEMNSDIGLTHNLGGTGGTSVVTILERK